MPPGSGLEWLLAQRRMTKTLVKIEKRKAGGRLSDGGSARWHMVLKCVYKNYWTWGGISPVGHVFVRGDWNEANDSFVVVEKASRRQIWCGAGGIGIIGLRIMREGVTESKKSDRMQPDLIHHHPLCTLHSTRLNSASAYFIHSSPRCYLGGGWVVFNCLSGQCDPGQPEL